MSCILPDGFNSQINLGSRNKFGKHFLSMKLYRNDPDEDTIHEIFERDLVKND